MRRSNCFAAALLCLPLLCGCSILEPITIDESEIAVPQITLPDTDGDGPTDTSLYGQMLYTLQKGENHLTYLGTADAEEVSGTFTKILQDYPEIFWATGLQSEVSGPMTEITFTLMDGYDAQDFVKMLAQTTVAADAAAATAHGLESDYDKALYVHDFLVENVEYDYDGQASGEFGIYCTAYGALVNRKATGRGYADAYLLILHRLGVEVGICTGMTGQGEHTWNYVKLDGNYYWVDVAWDDPQTPDAPHVLRHTYCFLPDDRILTQRTVYSSNYKVPTCTEMALNYFTVQDAVYTTYNFDVLSERIAQEAETGACELMFSDAVIANVAVTELIDNGGIWRVRGVSSSSMDVSYSLSGDSHVLLLVFAPKETS